MSTENQNILNNQIRHTCHEIRNNLSVCDVYSEIIKKHLEKDGIKNESILRAVNCIQNSLKLISNSLTDLKSFDNITLRIYDSYTLISDAFEMSKVYAKDKDIDFELDLIRGVKIFVDENKFEGCLINLIKNAVEAIDGEGKIAVKSFAEDDKLFISVVNNGKPIPDKIRAKLFDDGFTTKNSGSGTGLYLCRKNLQAQKASVVLKTSEKNLTEFQIIIDILKN